MFRRSRQHLLDMRKLSLSISGPKSPPDNKKPVFGLVTVWSVILHLQIRGYILWHILLTTDDREIISFSLANLWPSFLYWITQHSSQLTSHICGAEASSGKLYHSICNSFCIQIACEFDLFASSPSDKLE